MTGILQSIYNLWLSLLSWFAGFWDSLLDLIKGFFASIAESMMSAIQSAFGVILSALPDFSDYLPSGGVVSDILYLVDYYVDLQFFLIVLGLFLAFLLAFISFKVVMLLAEFVTNVIP